MSFRRAPLLIAVAISALVLAACADDGDVDDAAQPDELPDELDDLDELDDELDLDDMFGDQGDMPDPNEHVEDGVFRGDGIILPIPEGFELEPTAYLQGLVAAVTPDGLQQVAGQAVDSASVPDESLEIDELAEMNEQQFGPSVSDEETEIDGATRARQLIFEAIPAQQEGQPELSLVLVIAEDGEGEIAIFNYVAPAEDFDQAEAETLLAGVGFDPDSSPREPEPMPAP